MQPSRWISGCHAAAIATYNACTQNDSGGKRQVEHPLSVASKAAPEATTKQQPVTRKQRIYHHEQTAFAQRAGRAEAASFLADSTY